MRDNIYKQAIQVQDACNMLGVVNTLHTEILPAVREEYKNGSTLDINTHPAVQMFAFKIAALASGECLCNVSMEMFSKAYDVCKARANGK